LDIQAILSHKNPDIFLKLMEKSNRFFYGSLFLTETAIREKIEI